MRNVLKFCTVMVLALVLVLGMFSAAFAAGSVTDKVEFWDGDTKVSTTGDVPALENTEAATLAKTEVALSKLWGGDVTSDNKTLECRIQGGKGDYYVFHYDEDAKAWEFVTKGTGEKFEVEFKSLSPVAVFSATEAPKTGDDSNLLLWGGLMAVAAAAAVGTVVYSKKRRSEA